jgi:hypothetical protein
MRNSEEWVLPTTVFKLIKGLSKHQTDEEIKKKREFDKLRESFIAAVFLLRKTLVETKPWYLRKNDIENSVDDIYARPFIIEENKVYSEEVLPIQTFQITEQSPSLLEAIESKLKDDLRNTSLVGYITRDDNIDWKSIHEHICKIKPNLIDIHIVASVFPSTYSVFQIYPNLNFVDISILQCILNAKPMIRATQVFKEKDSGVDYIGKFKLTPSMDIVENIK